MAGAFLRSVRLGLQGVRPSLRMGVRWSSDLFEYDYQKTEMKVEMLSQEEDMMMYVQSYSQLGFRLNSGVRIIGPCAVFPRSILHWNVKSVEDIDEASLSLFTLLEPKLDLLIIGKGDRHVSIDPKIIRYLRSEKINVEVLPTDQALATFNFLNAEKRYVAGAFLPPNYVQNELDEDAGMAEVAEEGKMFEAKMDYHGVDETHHLHFQDPYKQFEQSKKIFAKKFLKKDDGKDSTDKS